jgi:hypothetical protein
MSDHLAPVVTDVTTEDNRNAIFTFEDGHRLVLEGYFRGEGWPVEDLFRLRLFNGDELTVTYNFLGTSDQDEHRFIEVADGYTHDRIAAYWWSIYEHMGEEYISKPRRESREASTELYLPWMLASKANRVYTQIRSGAKAFPHRAQEWPVRECTDHGLISIDDEDHDRCPAPSITGDGPCNKQLSKPFVVVRKT